MTKNGLFLSDKSLFCKLQAVLNAIASLWIFVLMATIVIDVGGRYFFNSPLRGTPETVSNSIVAIAFLQFPYVLFVDRHVATNIFYVKFPYQIKRITQIIGNLVGTLVYTLLLIPGWKLFVKSWKIVEFDGTGGGFHFYTWPIRLTIIICSLVLALEYLRRAIKWALNKEVTGGEG